MRIEARSLWPLCCPLVPVDTVPLAGRPKPNLVLESVAVPGEVFSGERFPIEITVESPRSAAASVEMTAEGKTIGASQVQLVSGANHLRLQASVNSVGAIALAGKISAGDLGRSPFRGRRHPAPAARAAGLARSARERGASGPRPGGQSVPGRAAPRAASPTNSTTSSSS